MNYFQGILVIINKLDAQLIFSSGVLMNTGNQLSMAVKRNRVTDMIKLGDFVLKDGKLTHIPGHAKRVREEAERKKKEDRENRIAQMRDRYGILHSELCEVGKNWLIKKQRCHLASAEPSVAYVGEQPDCIGWKGYSSILIEVKVSRADFLKDKKKPFRVDPEKGMGNRRYYLCPEGVINESDLPEKWGLLIWNGKRVVEKVVALPQETHVKNELYLLVTMLRLEKQFDLRLTLHNAVVNMGGKNE